MSESQTMPETSEKGLTAAEVAALTESGQVNAVKSSTSRSFADIVRANVFTLFNGIIFVAMVMVLVTGSWRDAVFGLVILINTGIGIITELKAKRTLDKLSILVASDYLVRRDGKDVEVPHNEIVLGDLMWIRSGEQVPADAQIVRTWGLELDESMLTGESRTVRKNEGDDIYSGSTAVSGMALVKVNAVGAHSYAATLTAQAKVYKKTVSDLNKGINTILKFMTFLVVPLCVLLIWSQVHAVGGWDVAISTGQWRSAVVSAVAGVVGMIPEGLVLLTSLNFALAIKEADLGIAMGNAAPATKAVAQVVLVDSKFSHLPDVVARGRQVMANMERVASLFLVKTVYSALISLGVVLTQIPFPYLPRHITYIGALTIGMPAFILALAPNTRRYIPGFLRRVVHFALPGGIATALSILADSWLLPKFMGWDAQHSAAQLGMLRGVNAIILLMMGIFVLARVARPLNSWRGGLVLAFAVAGVAGMFIPPVARFFALVIPSGEMLAATGVALVVSAIVFVLCLWCVPKIVAIFSRFKKTRQC